METSIASVQSQIFNTTIAKMFMSNMSIHVAYKLKKLIDHIESETKDIRALKTKKLSPLVEKNEDGTLKIEIVDNKPFYKWIDTKKGKEFEEEWQTFINENTIQLPDNLLFVTDDFKDLKLNGAELTNVQMLFTDLKE
jgi:hypothetical protein